MMYKSHREVDPVFRTTTPIEYEDKDGGGTGFFLNHADQTYLVTNRHVVDPDDCSPERARIWVRRKNNIFNRNAIDLDLEASSSSLWDYHPNQNNIDISVAPIERDLTTIGYLENESQKTGSLAFSTDHFVHDHISFDSRIAVIGHPGSIVDSDSHFPIRRDALVATPYGATFDGDPIFLTDARIHDGMSGGPVIVGSGWASGSNIPNDRWKNYFLIGIHSQTYFDPTPTADSDEECGNSADEVRFDLNAAWYPRIISEILGQ